MAVESKTGTDGMSKAPFRIQHGTSHKPHEISNFFIHQYCLMASSKKDFSDLVAHFEGLIAFYAMHPLECDMDSLLQVNVGFKQLMNLLGYYLTFTV